VFFLASDGALGSDIAERLERAQISTRFVNRHYLDAMLTPDRLADLERAVAQPTTVNHDFNPVLYFHCLRHWASQFDSRLGVLEVAFGLALLAYLVRLRGPAMAVFASGFAASSLEVALLLGFQALCGSLYYQLGIIVTVFMAGLAAGAAWAIRSGGRRLLVLLALAIAALAALLPFVLKLLSGMPPFGGSTLAVQVVIGFLTFALAALVGAQFPVANRVGHGTAVTASRIYTADFLGASVGALLASAWLIPLLGVTMMCWLAAGLNLLGAAAVWWTGVAATRQSAAI
jgi:spermidine synthase